MMVARSHDALTLAELLDGIAFVNGHDDREVLGLCVDSRKVNPGDCFVALSGEDCHGAEFIHDAITAGATAVLVEDIDVVSPLATPVIRVNGLRKNLGRIASRFYGAPSSFLDVIAVTGTNGKTTVAQLCALALKQLRGDAGYAGTLGLGPIESLRPTLNTTPDPITLQEFFADLRDRDCRSAAIEVSSHAIVQSRVMGSALDVVIFTNVGHDHLDYHGSAEHYACVKKSLFQYEGIRHAIINADDPVGRELLAELPPELQRWSYSTVPPAADGAAHRALYLTRFTAEHAGSTLAVDTPQGEVEITTPLIGDFNAQNLMAALGGLMALGIDARAAADALSDTRGVPGRMELIDPGSAISPAVVVDYAHTPESLSRVLAALRSVTDGRVICVFGCGGDRDKSKRAPMGAAAERGSDKVIVTSDNPRGERNEDIAVQILAGMRSPVDVTVIGDRALAIKAAIDAAGGGDTVLVAGKGHECNQEINGELRPFSDCAVVYQVLQGQQS